MAAVEGDAGQPILRTLTAALVAWMTLLDDTMLGGVCRPFAGPTTRPNLENRWGKS